jgi:hypothetical protein
MTMNRPSSLLGRFPGDPGRSVFFARWLEQQSIERQREILAVEGEYVDMTRDRGDNPGERDFQESMQGYRDTTGDPERW